MNVCFGSNKDESKQRNTWLGSAVSLKGAF